MILCSLCTVHVDAVANAYNMRNVTMLYFDTVSTCAKQQQPAYKCVTFHRSTRRRQTLIMSIYIYVHTYQSVQTTHMQRRNDGKMEQTKKGKKNNFDRRETGGQVAHQKRLNRCFIQMFSATQHFFIAHVLAICVSYICNNPARVKASWARLECAVLGWNAFITEPNCGSSFQ